MINESLQIVFSQGSPIPIQLISNVKTNWLQFITSLIFSSLILLFILWSKFQIGFSFVLTKLMLWKYKRVTGKRVLLIRHNVTDFLSSQHIDEQTLSRITLALAKFKGKAFDLILHTPGGTIFHANQIARIFKNYPGRIRAIIPQYAMSGGTMLALSCDEIIMGQTATLGPVDPQLGTFWQGAMPAAAYKEVIKKKKTKAGDNTYIFSRMGEQLQQMVRTELNTNMKVQCNDKENFLNFITEGDMPHIFGITKSELEYFKIPVQLLPITLFFTKLLKLKTQQGVIWG